MSASTLRCVDCDPARTFKSSEQECRHRLVYQVESSTIVTLSKSAVSKTLVVNKIDGFLKCPICGTSLTTKTGCRKHLKNGLCAPERESNQDPPDLTLPVQPETRAFDDAALYGCGDLHTSASENQKTFGIVESLGLEPISIKDALGIEQNALVHATASCSPVELNEVVPQKRKFNEDVVCSNCSPLPAPGLEHLLSSSPCTARLATRSYVELNDETCELLNRDWQFSPHLRYASAVVLAGCILINNKNRQAVIANTVEAYGRQKA
ncbi:hypothetical protein BGZ76_006661, partial [Entomortierella beljakovae]